MLRCLLCAALLAGAAGCQRPWYRRDADREAYTAERQHEDESRWAVARTDITPAPSSRLFDPFNPDYPPLPPDDPAAYFFMQHPDGQPAPRTYHRDGDAPWIEDPAWRNNVDLDKDGNLVLTPNKAVEVGILNSREYQQALENLYLVSLTLTLDRWSFALQFHGTNSTMFTQFGSTTTGFNALSTTNDVGFSRNLASGGQLLADFANSFVFTYTGANTWTATSNIAVALMQPLLRNAGRRVALENLIQSERNVLYAVRTFADYRKQFYVNLTTSGSGSYLGLLSQVQNIRNQESNLKSQEQNLRLHEALYARGTVSSVQVDQVFQSYQQGKLNLVQAQTSLDTSLDAYRLSLGLPPSLPVKLDDSILNPFQLAAPELEKLQGELDGFFAEYRELEQAPPAQSLRTGYDRLKAYQLRLLKLADLVEDELGQWRKQGTASSDDPAQAKREQATRASLERQMPELRAEINKMVNDLNRDQVGLLEATRVKTWESLQKRARQLIASAAQVYVVQTQVRVYLIRLQPIPSTLQEAEEFARANRLDLMNQRAQVVDAWRKIEVTASALKAGLDVTVSANLATLPYSHNPVDFRASASQYTVGLAFDTPLNRKVERNLYRVSLINYEQARRSYMALDDQIQAAIRLDVRQLETQRANFGIGRQSLIVAARQVEAARDRLLVLPNAAETTGTQDVLNALQSLLDAKTTLINSWINYQSGVAQLLLDMDALQLDPRGLPSNESNDTTASVHLGTPVPVPDQLPSPRVLPADRAGGG